MLLFKPIKYAIFFVLSYLLLSFPINQKPLFNHLYSFSKGATQPIYNFGIAQANMAFRSTTELVKKLFYNAKPNLNMEAVLAAPEAKVIEHNDPELDHFTDQEKEVLSEMLTK